MTEGRGSRAFRNPLSPGNPLAPVYLCVFLFSAGEHMLHVLVPPYLGVELGARPALVGAVLAAFAAASLVGRLPTGALYTLGRARRLLVVGGAVSGIAFALVPVVRAPFGIGVLMAADGIGWALATTVQLAVLVAARPDGLSTASAMGWYSGFNGLGNAVGGALAGLLADSVGFSTAFLVLAMLPTIATAVMAVAMPWDRLRATSIDSSNVHRGRGAWRNLAGVPAAAWAGVIVMVFINVVSAVANGFHPLLALGAGLSLTQVGLLSSCRSWSSSTVRLGSGVIFARTDGRWMTLPLILLSAGSLFLLPNVASSFLLQVPLFLGMGLARGLLRITGSTEAFEGCDDERRHGVIAALLWAGLDLGKLVGPVLGGTIADAFGLAAMFRIVPLLLLGVYFPVEFVARRAVARARAVSSQSGRSTETAVG